MTDYSDTPCNVGGLQSCRYACGGAYVSKDQIQNHTDIWFGSCGKAETSNKTLTDKKAGQIARILKDARAVRAALDPQGGNSEWIRERVRSLEHRNAEYLHAVETGSNQRYIWARKRGETLRRLTAFLVLPEVQDEAANYYKRGSGEGETSSPKSSYTPGPRPGNCPCLGMQQARTINKELLTAAEQLFSDMDKQMHGGRAENYLQHINDLRAAIAKAKENK
jgi:hypothetical protein